MKNCNNCNRSINKYTRTSSDICRKCIEKSEIESGIRKRCYVCKVGKPVKMFDIGYNSCKTCLISVRKQQEIKIACVCGSSYRKDGKHRHINTNKHKNWIKGI